MRHLRAIININSLRADAGRTHELDLLGLLIAQRCGTLQGVEMEFVERLLSHYGLHGVPRHGFRLHGVRSLRHCALLNFVHVARKQLDTRILKRLAALVAHRDPAHHIEDVNLACGFIRNDQVVIRLPAHSATDVRNFGVEFSRIVRLQQPVQRGLQNRVARKRGEKWLTG